MTLRTQGESPQQQDECTCENVPKQKVWKLSSGHVHTDCNKPVSQEVLKKLGIA